MLKWLIDVAGVNAMPHSRQPVSYCTVKEIVIEC
jgi:hypothetical protein